MFVFGFVRESLREPRWAASAAALAVAFQPQAAFIAGGVNNDNLMFTAAAALFWLLARAHRRRLDTRRGAAIGLVVAIGLLTKLTFIGLLTCLLVALVLIAWRQGGDERRGMAGRSLGAAAGVAATPVAIYLALNATIWHRSIFQGALGASSISGVSSGAGPASGNFRELLSYIWQFYLPCLPGMRAQFSFYPVWHIWFKGFVGDFGLLDYGFANWVYYLAGAIFLMLAALALRALVSERRSLRSRWPEIVSYGAITIGLLLAIARAGFPYHLQTHFVFEQARYLFPLLALYGLFLAVALRGAGRRWSPALAGVLVVAMIAHDLFAQLLTLQRYWA
jgi:4-amino-4-deoxy-L-arabinose transferase-like glycosyltransferase